MDRAEIVTVYSMHGDYTDESLSVKSIKPTGKLTIPQVYAGKGIMVLKVDNEAAVSTVRRGAYVGIVILFPPTLRVEKYLLSIFLMKVSY